MKKYYPTPQRDAELNEELRPELPKIGKVVEKAFRNMQTLSDIGQVAAIVRLTAALILNFTNDRELALSVAESWAKNVEGQIKATLATQPPAGEA